MEGVVERQLGFANLGAPRTNNYDLLYAPLRMPDVVGWIDVYLPTTHMYLRSRISNEPDIPSAVELSAMTKTWLMWASPLRNVQKSYSLLLVITFSPDGSSSACRDPRSRFGTCYHER